MMRVFSYAVGLLAALLPLHAIYILRQGSIGTPPGVWQYGTIGIYAFDVFALIVLVFGGVLCWRLRLSAHYRAIFLALLALWSWSTFLWSSDLYLSLAFALRFTCVLVLFYVCTLLPISRALCMGLVVGALIQSALAFSQFFSQYIGASTLLGIAEHASYILGDSVVEVGDQRWLRAYGSFPHPALLGGYLAAGLVCMYSLCLSTHTRWRTLLSVLASACILAALIITFTRSAWIAVICTLLFTAWMYRKSVFSLFAANGRVLPLGMLVITHGIIVAVFGALLSMPLSARLGLSTPHRLEVRSLTERTASIHEGLAVIRSTFPRGTGPGAYTQFVANTHPERPAYTYQPVHSTPLLLIAEMGGVGVFMILSVLGLVWIRIRHMMTHECGTLAVQLTLILCIVGMLDHYLWSTPSGLWMTGLFLAAAPLALAKSS